MLAPAPTWDALHARFAAHGARFAFVIPVFNHARNLAMVARQALQSGAPVIVVDDGSTDETAGVLAGIAGITVVRHDTNQGKGAAILTGLLAASQPSFQACFAVTVDGDGQHRPDEARRLLQAVCERELAPCLVVGSRLGMNDAAVPWSSRMGRGFSGFWVRATGGPALSDSQSGFRVYPIAETLALTTRARRFEFEVEVLVRAHRAGIPISEVPISVDYQPPGGRVSHFRPWRDFGRNSMTFSRLLAARLLPRFSVRDKTGAKHRGS